MTTSGNVCTHAKMADAQQAMESLSTIHKTIAMDGGSKGVTYAKDSLAMKTVSVSVTKAVAVAFALIYKHPATVIGTQILICATI